MALSQIPAPQTWGARAGVVLSSYDGATMLCAVENKHTVQVEASELGF